MVCTPQVKPPSLRCSLFTGAAKRVFGYASPPVPPNLTPDELFAYISPQYELIEKVTPHHATISSSLTSLAPIPLSNLPSASLWMYQNERSSILPPSLRRRPKR